MRRFPSRSGVRRSGVGAGAGRDGWWWSSAMISGTCTPTTWSTGSGREHRHGGTVVGHGEGVRAGWVRMGEWMEMVRPSLPW
jgi:hypothetical protein